MRREFLKNDDFQNPRMEKPVEFEIKDYDTAVKNSKYPIWRQKAQPSPSNKKSDLALRRLDSGLDGNHWECTETHRRHLRVRTTGIQEEEEYLDSWDNTIPVDSNEAAERDCSKLINKSYC